ncbi:MAG: hypothetical protein ACYDD0_11645, partial [Candidatus Dormibacteria bacterium]
MIDSEAPHEERTVTQVEESPGRREATTYRSQGPVTSTSSRLGQLVWLAAGVVAVILALDFIFKLIAANSIGFVAFIGSLGGALSAPFRGILSTTITPGAHVTYWPDLAAIVVYAVAAWIVSSLIRIVATPRSRGARPA